MRSFLIIAMALLTGPAFAQTNRVKAEVFIELADRGNFTVYLDNEFVGSASGRFRFYEIYNSQPTLSIMNGNTVVFKRRINTREGKRIIFRYAGRGGLTVSKELELFRNRQYILNDWDDEVGAYNTGIVPPGRQATPGMKPVVFNNLLNLVKKESFDEGRMKLINAAIRSAYISTAQLRPLLLEMRFEDNKLSLAKSAYVNCPDKENYFTLVDTFTFKSNKDLLLDFISKN